MGCPVSLIAKSGGRGRGCPASEAARHWGAQRVSALLLVLLTPWLVISLLGQLGQPAAAVALWVGQATVALPMALFLLIGFWHTAQGLQVIVEDYVPTPSVQRLTVRLVWVGCLIFMLAGCAALARLVFFP